MRKLVSSLLLVFICIVVSYAPDSSQMLGVNNISEVFDRHQKYLKISKISEIESSEFSVERFKEYLKLKDVEDYEVIIQQAICESGWFTSQSFTKYNNIFGMKMPKCRETTATHVGLGHAGYSHWTKSVQDYLLWRGYWEGFGYETSNYYAFLEDIGYATNPNYIKILKSININKELNRC